MIADSWCCREVEGKIRRISSGILVVRKRDAWLRARF